MTPACLACHYMPEVRRGTLRAGAGVTCESCHGPALDWVDVHNDYGVAGSDRQAAARAETPEHRTERVANSLAAGMRRPSQLYEVAANCFGCHTVPNEEIVNVANHTTGGEFELVERSYGDIRHNFLESLKTGDGTINAERPPEWKRLMYVVGRALDFEYSLRGVAAASVDGRYLDSMSNRVGSAFDALAEMTDVMSLPEIDAMFEIYESVDLVPNNATALTAAADRVQDATRAFIARYDGTEMAALDQFWNPDAPALVLAGDPGPAEPARSGRDAVAVVGEAGDEPSVEAILAKVPPDDARTEAAAQAVAPEAGAAQPPPRAAATVQYEVQSKPAWRVDPSHRFVKTVPCGGCHEHAKQTEWWAADTHSGTIEPFKANTEESQGIAWAYGIAVGDTRKGAQTCMWCHGTITGSPRLDVRNSVGCQMCHGAAKGYEKSHEEESYADSLMKGLTDLKDADVRARTCAGCHYITDPGLIAAGHESGDSVAFAEQMSQIKHWGPEFGGDASEIGASTLASAYAGVLTARGPVPQVTPVETPAQPTVAGGDAASAVPTQVDQTTSTTAPAGTPARTAVSSGGGASSRGNGGAGVASRVPVVGSAGELEPLSVADDTPIERILLRVKERLELLYERLGRGTP